ncbi:MAG TPA: hypothetical protein VK586_08090 [Streptosporangiaceae bacterium]|nr:hypothetical protein [Streptosporangiaceae bacterium]
MVGTLVLTWERTWERTEKLMASESELGATLSSCAARASALARATMATVRDRAGFLPRR